MEMAGDGDQPLSDVSIIAHLLKHQFKLAPGAPYRSFSDMFLQDNFALGYCFGFSQSAAILPEGMSEQHNSDALPIAIFRQLVSDLSRAESFVAYASYQQRNIVFQKGCDAACLDYEDWRDNGGDFVPLALALHLQKVSL